MSDDRLRRRASLTAKERELLANWDGMTEPERKALLVALSILYARSHGKPLSRAHLTVLAGGKP